MADKEKNTRSAASKERYFQAGVALVTVLLFFGILIGLGCVTTFSEKESFSENQNKALASFPKFSGKRLFNGSFTSGLETYVSDHFAWHDEWITAQTYSELALGKKERNNVYFMKNGGLAEKISEPDMTVVGKSISGIQQFATDNGIMPYIMIVPTQAEIYSDMLPTDAPNPDQAEFINNVYSQLDGYAVPIDVYSVLSANRDDYIYYRTDHHWTSLGAYYGYTALMEAMGMEPVDLADYERTTVTDQFYGTIFSASGVRWVAPDRIDTYIPADGVKVTSYFAGTPSQGSLYVDSYLEVKDKYSYFLGGVQHLCVVETGLTDAPRLLLIRDSYSDSLTPFLTQSFSQIHLFDPRYNLSSIQGYIQDNGIDAVAVLYSIPNYIADEYQFVLSR